MYDFREFRPSAIVMENEDGLLDDFTARELQLGSPDSGFSQNAIYIQPDKFDPFQFLFDTSEETICTENLTSPHSLIEENEHKSPELITEISQAEGLDYFDKDCR